MVTKLVKETIVARANELYEELGELPDDKARWRYVKHLCGQC
jgi:hypothetical protein